MAFLLWPVVVLLLMMMMVHHHGGHAGLCWSDPSTEYCTAAVVCLCACVDWGGNVSQCKLSNYREAAMKERRQWFVAQRWLARASEAAPNCPITWLHTGFMIRLAGENFILVLAPLMAMATATKPLRSTETSRTHTHTSPTGHYHGVVSGKAVLSWSVCVWPTKSHTSLTFAQVKTDFILVDWKHTCQRQM